VPTHRQILKYFFKREEIEEMLESLEYAIDGPPDLESLGEPDEVETATGTEWEISRAKWNTKRGPKYLIYLKKVGNYFSDIDFPNVNLNHTMDSSRDEFFKHPFFNYQNDVEDIEHEDVEPMTFQEQLDYAIENENFEEAARLRDWNNGLIELLKELKPMFIQAISNGDLDSLDRYHKRLNDYRAKL
jgi:hypothetical protein